MEYAFTCICKCLFGKYIKDDQPIEAECPLCHVNVTDALPMGRSNRGRTATNVMSDIEPYKSPLDGSVVTSRSQHRDHMRKHEVIEMGNEYPKHMDRDRAPIDRAGKDIVRSLEQASR